MTKPVVPGQPIVPAMTAQWYNNTLRKPSKPSLQKKRGEKHHNEHVATFQPSENYPIAERFTPVAIVDRIDTYGKRIERAHYVDKESLNQSNWIIPQAEMSASHKTQPCVYAGLTYAKVTIRNPLDKYVNLNPATKTLQSDIVGKGLILTRGEEYSLISVETYVPERSSSGSVVKFRTLQNIELRSFPAFDLTGTYGIITINDPNNLWSSITSGCIGTAFWNKKYNKWEVLTCSLPANEIVCEITEPLLLNEPVPPATVVSGFQLRSTYPNVMGPPSCNTICEYTWNVSTQSYQLTEDCEGSCECSPPPENPPEDTQLEGQIFPGICQSEEEEEIIIDDYTNPLNLDAVCNSLITLQRVTDAKFGEPLETFDEEGSATDYRWEVIRVEQKHARFITFAYNETSVTVESFCDGFDPSDCGDVDVTYPLGAPCPGDTVTAYYCPASNTYKAIATQSAMMGSPENVDVPVSTEAVPCGIKVNSYPFKMFHSTCTPQEEPDETLVNLGTTIPVVVAVSAGDCGKIDYAWQNIKAFACDNAGEPTSPSFSDFTLNLGDTKFVYDAYFNGCSLVLVTKTIIDACVPYVPGSGGVLPTLITSSPTLVELPVVTEVYEGVDAIIIERATAYVCAWEAEPEDQIPLTPCPVEPPPPTCEEQFTVYEWNTETEAWELLTACPEGCSDGSPPQDPPGEDDPFIVNVPCTPLGGG